MNPLDRREFLGLGALGAVAAVGGCLQSTGGGNSYTDWIPRRDAGQLVAYVDFSVAKESQNAQELFPMILPSGDGPDPSYAPTFRDLDALQDPLLTLPLDVGGSVIGLSALSLSVTGLDYLLDAEAPTEGVTEIVYADGAVVATGEIDADRADSALRSGTETATTSFPHERSGEHDDFAIYETTTTDGDSFVAVDDSAVVVADDREHVVSTIETREGSRPRASDQDDTLGWLLDEAGDGHFVLGWDGPVSLDRHLFGTASEQIPDAIDSGRQSVLSSVRFAPAADELEARFALHHDELTASTREQLISRFGAESAEESTSASGARLSITGTYTNDAVDFQYVEAGEDDGDDRPNLNRDPPPAVENAVPDDAFSFSHDPEKQTMRVDFEKRVSVDEITVRGVQSGNEVSSDTPENMTFMNVLLTDEDTEVVVIATVDGESGVVASESIPE